jgi:hypothetical protein
MNTSPFHSQFRGIAVEDLWHDNTECQIGGSIAAIDRLPGKGRQRKHCPYCALHNLPLSPTVRW